VLRNTNAFAMHGQFPNNVSSTTRGRVNQSINYFGTSLWDHGVGYSRLVTDPTSLWGYGGLGCSIFGVDPPNRAVGVGQFRGTAPSS
jgi:hypothetical protein